MLFVERQNQQKVTEGLHDLRPIRIGFEGQGSKIIFVGEMG